MRPGIFGSIGQTGLGAGLAGQEEQDFNQYLQSIQANVPNPMQTENLYPRNPWLGIGLAIANGLQPGVMDSYTQGRQQFLAQKMQQKQMEEQQRQVALANAEKVASLRYGRTAEKTKEWKQGLKDARTDSENKRYKNEGRYLQAFGALKTANMPGDPIAAWEEMNAIDPVRASMHKETAIQLNNDITQKWNDDKAAREFKLEKDKAVEKRASELFPDKKLAGKYAALQKQFDFDIISPLKQEAMAQRNKWYDKNMASIINDRDLDNQLAEKRFTLASEALQFRRDDAAIGNWLNTRNQVMINKRQYVTDLQGAWGKIKARLADLSSQGFGVAMPKDATPEQMALHQEYVNNKQHLATLESQLREERNRLKEIETSRPDGGTAAPTQKTDPLGIR